VGVFNKLMNILFDEQEVEEEIPTITKTKKEEIESIKKPKPIEDDEIIVKKIEKNPNEDETLFDIPKLTDNEEKIDEDNVPTRTFTFPMIDDDEDEELPEDMPKRSKKETIKDETKPDRQAYDYLSSTSYKYKSDVKSDAYTSSRNNIYDDNNIGKKPFVPSPVISPVYGVLNENYKKEDIVEKENAGRLQREKMDLDSVRRKAYGTLEDEIEISLGKSNSDDLLDEVPEDEEMSIDKLSEEGISIRDLLVEDEKNETSETNEELFDIDEDEKTEEVEEEIELDDNIDKDETAKIEIVDESEFDEKEDREEINGDDDLFDLIDSIYQGKDEEE